MPSRISPAVADAFQLLRADLYRYLDEADLLATRWDTWSSEDISTARELIPDLILVARQLLREHDVTTEGACEMCTSTWPCSVVNTIHRIIKAPDNRLSFLVDTAESKLGESRWVA